MSRKGIVRPTKKQTICCMYCQEVNCNECEYEMCDHARMFTKDDLTIECDCEFIDKKGEIK